jgi:hypothetical protein
MSIKIKSLVVLILIVFISSCGDSDGESPSSGVEGTWSLKELSIRADATVTVAGQDFVTRNVITGSDFDYTINFSDGDFTASGSYTATNEITATGIMDTFVTRFNNISGSGSYTDSGTEVTFSNQLFSFDEIAGMTGGETEMEQTIAYEINAAGQLVMTQNESITVSDSGISSVTVFDSVIVWERN